MSAATDINAALTMISEDAEILRKHTQGPADGPDSSQELPGGTLDSLLKLQATHTAALATMTEAADAAAGSATNSEIAADRAEAARENLEANALGAPHPVKGKWYLLDDYGVAIAEFSRETYLKILLAAGKPAVAGKSTPYYTSAVSGAPSAAPILTPTTIAGVGDFVAVVNAAQSISPLADFPCDDDRMHRVLWDNYRSVGTAPATDTITYQIVWLDSARAELSRTTIEVVKDMRGTTGRAIRADIVGPDNGISNIVPPANAVRWRPVAVYVGTAHTDGVKIDVVSFNMPAKPQLLDGTPGVSMALGGLGFQSGFVGGAVELLRVDGGSTTRTFAVSSNGRLDVRAVAQFAGPYGLQVVNALCQRTKRRTGQALDTLKPRANIVGPGILSFSGTGNAELTFGSNTGPACGQSQNVDALTIVMGFWYGRTRYGSDQHAAYFNDSGGDKRLALTIIGRVDPALGSTLGMTTARQDADTPEKFNSGLIIDSGHCWAAVTAKFSNNDRIMRLGGKGRKTRKVVATSAGTTGSTSNTPSQKISVGTMTQSHYTALAIVQGELTDEQFNRIVARSPDMDRIVYGETRAIPQFNQSWFSYAYGLTRPNGWVIMGFTDRYGGQFIAEIPPDSSQEGRISTVSTRYTSMPVQSDHMSPVLKDLPDQSLFVLNPGQGDAGYMPCKVSRTGRVADLGPEFLLQTGAGNLSYAQSFVYEDKLIIVTKISNQWGMWLCNDSTDPRLSEASFGAYQPIINHTSSFYLVASEPGGERRNVKRWIVSTRPKDLENHCYSLELDMDTGIFSSGGTPLGNMDGSAAGGNTLPCDLSDLAKIWSVPTGKSIRLFNASFDGSGFNVVVMDPANAAVPGTYYHIHLTDPDHPELEASWTAYQVGPTGGAGLTTNWDDVRFPGSVTNQREGAATLSVEACIFNSGTGRYELTRFDSAAGDMSDAVATVLLDRPDVLQRPFIPRNAKARTPTICLELVPPEGGPDNSINVGHLVYDGEPL